MIFACSARLGTDCTDRVSGEMQMGGEFDRTPPCCCHNVQVLFDQGRHYNWVEEQLREEEEEEQTDQEEEEEEEEAEADSLQAFFSSSTRYGRFLALYVFMQALGKTFDDINFVFICAAWLVFAK